MSDFKLVLKIDIKPFNEGIKSAVKIAELSSKEINAVLTGIKPHADTKQFDKEIKRLQKTLNNLEKDETKVIITAEDENVNKTIKKIQTNAKNAGKSLSGLRDSIASWGFALQGVKTMLAPVVKMVNETIESAMIQEKAEKKVEQAVRSTGMAAGFSATELKKMASGFQEITTYGDEEILNNVTAQLLTFTNIAGDQFKDAQMAAMNLSTVLDGDLKSASIQLGKALNDPITNLSALSRSGIQFTTEQKKMIKALWEAGDKAKAQSLILKELNRQYGGQAEAMANTYTGALKQFNNSWGDLKETIGFGVLPVIAGVADKLKNLIYAISPVKTEFDGLVQKAQEQKVELSYLSLEYETLSKKTNLTKEELNRYNTVVNDLIKISPKYLSILKKDNTTFKDKKKAIDDAKTALNEYYEQLVTKQLEAEYEAKMVKYGVLRKKQTRDLLDTYIKVNHSKNTILEQEVLEISKLTDIAELEKQRRKHGAPTDDLRQLINYRLKEVEMQKKLIQLQKDEKDILGEVKDQANAANKKITDTAKKITETTSKPMKLNLDVDIDDADEGLDTFEKDNKEFNDDITKSNEEGIKKRLADNSKYINKKLNDQKKYYQIVKFEDSGYEKWKKTQIETEIDAMNISEDQKVELKKQKLAELKAAEDNYNENQKKGKRLLYDTLSAMSDAFYSSLKNSINEAINYKAERSTEEIDLEMQLNEESYNEKADQFRDEIATAKKNGKDYKKLLLEQRKLDLDYNKQKKELLLEREENEKSGLERMGDALKKAMKDGIMAAANMAAAAAFKSVWATLGFPAAIVVAPLTAAAVYTAGAAFASAFQYGGQVADADEKDFLQQFVPPGEDTLIAVQKKEYVMPVKPTERYLPILERMKNMSFSDGGLVGDDTVVSEEGLSYNGAMILQVLKEIRGINRQILNKKTDVNVNNEFDIQLDGEKIAEKVEEIISIEADRKI